jgi:hypothetical protein
VLYQIVQDHFETFRAQATLSGSFSGDGQQLAGKEIRTSTSAGQEYLYGYDWRAVKK